MLYGLLVTLFVFVCFCLILIVLVQQSKGGLGFSSLGSGAQMIFGGSGGQDVLQKITWVLVIIFMAGSLLLALMRSQQRSTFRYTVKGQSTDYSSEQLPNSSEMPD